MNFIVIILMISTLTIFLSTGNSMIFPVYPQTIENDNTGELSINQISPCSMTIETDFTLETNLNCYKDGLIVSGSGITIDLNGKTITGPGKTLEHSGIVILGNDVTIKGPGTITNFQKGVNLLNSNTIDVNSLILQNNQFGIFFIESSSGEINENNINFNNIGISAYSSNNLIFKNNLITDNQLSGITLVNTNQYIDLSFKDSKTVTRNGNEIFTLFSYFYRYLCSVIMNNIHITQRNSSYEIYYTLLFYC